MPFWRIPSRMIIAADSCESFPALNAIRVCSIVWMNCMTRGSVDFAAEYSVG